jgi:hypothetical protein
MARNPERKVPVTITMSPALKSALEMEAWECQRSLADYLRGLLERRGKWARSVGTAGGYDLMTPISKVNDD